MNFWDKIFLKGIKKFPYGSLEIEWPNGRFQKNRWSSQRSKC